jgi:hypothetical protein
MCSFQVYGSSLKEISINVLQLAEIFEVPLEHVPKFQERIFRESFAWDFSYYC